jgi:DNA-binding SARP family transcriptional activator
MLHLRWLGSPRVRRDDVELGFDTRKAVALLAYVSVDDRPAARDVLCELLWSGLDRSRARAALRRTLSVAASAVPEIVVAGDAIGLDAARVRCDVLDFRALVASDAPADWERAAQHAVGDFLDGFALRDAPLFEQWHADVAATLRDDLALVLGMLVTQAASERRLADALGYARRRITVDPLAEPAYVDLIRLLAAQGDRTAAFAAYRALVEVLDSQLGIAPLPGTHALMEEVRAGTLLVAAGGEVTTARKIVAAAVRSGAESAAVDDLAASVTARFQAVGDTTRQVVEALTVLGVSVDIDVVRQVAGRTADETSAAIEEGLGAGLVATDAEAGDGGERGFRVAHRLVADVSRSALPLARERLLHARAAEALARPAGVGPAIAERVGRHHAVAGDDADAAAWFVAAAEGHSRADDHAATIDALRSAQTVGGSTVAVQVALGTALVRVGRTSEALAALGRAADLAGDDPSVLSAAEDAVAFAEASGDLEAVVALRSHYADLLHTAGREDEARAQQQRWAVELSTLLGASRTRSTWL